eukprot:gene22938-biopygen1220
MDVHTRQTNPQNVNTSTSPHVEAVDSGLHRRSLHGTGARCVWLDQMRSSLPLDLAAGGRPGPRGARRGRGRPRLLLQRGEVRPNPREALREHPLGERDTVRERRCCTGCCPRTPFLYGMLSGNTVPVRDAIREHRSCTGCYPGTPFLYGMREHRSYTGYCPGTPFLYGMLFGNTVPAYPPV